MKLITTKMKIVWCGIYIQQARKNLERVVLFFLAKACFSVSIEGGEILKILQVFKLGYG